MYHYEMLGDERFQQFCQALIAASFPNTQCLPTGQPDGGRDAFVLRWMREQQRLPALERELVIFQVKFIKKVNDSRSERDMIEQIARSEKAKLDKLKGRGAFKYYLITNLKGTAHPDAGSIDRVNKALSEALEVEAYCWWRDDLDRRLDNASGIKWSYPEILKATDLLEKLVAGQLGEEEERRRGAIRAYVTAQYEEDKELKFKQTDLRSTMTDLFVDLPMWPLSPWNTPPRFNLKRAIRAPTRHSWYAHELAIEPGRNTLAAASFFMHQTGYTNFENVVLEGAPGQGKSTITQFLCQALRMALLGKSQDLAAIQQGLRPSQLRIPFRVDLRDLAKWISGIDPFHAKQRALDEQEPRSLEGFLAGQIRFLSGGHSFNVSDLTAVARASHILLALDGFDEVAEIGLRQQLVTEISKGTNRLVAAGGYSVQAIVTSRPAAFAKSVRFPRETWAYFELLPLEQSQIDEYTTKWTKAKGLKDSEALALKQILEVKIKESHTQYLAKNPMQLTILLSLINSRGASLPEKRTAMYDAYMDTFFSRESEKSTVVRDNRELLIDIHRYLAWKLQTSAETGENGSIEHSALRTLLFSYLDREGENTSIVDALFNGIIERVGALVSRVQETYEFEVQPLREYFAARHLYETAPYPSDEQPLAGDKFDRFKALVRNPYWLNVARFYGGCFNKGEILTLVNELTELSRQEPYTWTSHPRSVALMLLGDWVFTQYQPAVRQIIAFITEYPQLRQLLANAEHGNSLWSSLPERSGRGEFVEVLWKRLFTTKLADEQRALANAIQQNTPIDERITRWKAGASMVSLAVWARIGSYLHLYEVASLRDLCLDHIRLNDEILKHLLMMSRYDLLENEAYFERAKSLLLDSMTNGGVGLEQGRFGRLAMIASLTWVSQYTIAQIDETDLPLKYVLERRFGSRFARTVEVIERQADTLAPEEREAAEAYRLFLDTQTSMLSTNLAPWSELVAAFRKAWGDCSAIDRIAFWGAGVRSKGATGSDVPLAEAPDLVEAARYIRLRSGAPMWWREQLLADQPQTERRRLLQLLLQWGTAKTLVKVLDVLDTTLNSLDLGQWDRLIRDYRSGQFGELTNLFELSKSDLTRVRQTSARLNLYLGLRLIPAQRFELAKAMAEMPLIGGGPEGPFALQTLVTQCREATRWKSALPKIETLYAGGASTLTRVDRDYSMPASVALRVSSAPEHYPLALVAFADAQLTAQAGTQAPKLVEVANEEAWFQP